MTIKNSFGVWRRLHTVAGVIVAPFLIVAALTGLLYAFAPTLEDVVYRGETSASAGEQVPLAKQVEAARAVHPDLTLSTVQVIPGQATRVLFADPSLPSKSYTRAVFVDPADAHVRGEEVQYGSSRALPLRAWLSSGHRSLWLGAPGRFYSELAASWLGALTLSGLYVWLRRRKKTKNTMRTHSLIGAWFSAGFLFLTVTGLTWSTVAGGNIAHLRNQLNWQTPTLSAAGGEHADHAGHGGMTGMPGMEGMQMDMSKDFSVIDGVLSTAREHGLQGILNLTPPQSPDGNWIVAEAREAFKWHNDAIAVDPMTLDVTNTLNFADWPLAAKLTAWLIQLHMGTMMGIANQLVLAVIAVALLVMTILGLKMYFDRGRRFAGPQKVSGWFLAGVVAYSIIAPLFGASLLLFVALDWAWRRLRPVGARRGREGEPANEGRHALPEDWPTDDEPEDTATEQAAERV